MRYIYDANIGDSVWRVVNFTNEKQVVDEKGAEIR
jgi:hypothetical protein